MALRCAFGRRSLLLCRSVNPQRNLGFCGSGGGGATVVKHYSQLGNVEDDFITTGNPRFNGIYPRRTVFIYRHPEFDERKNRYGHTGGITRFQGSLSDPEVIEASLSAIKQFNNQQASNFL